MNRIFYESLAQRATANFALRLFFAHVARIGASCSLKPNSRSCMAVSFVTVLGWLWVGAMIESV